MAAFFFYIFVLAITIMTANRFYSIKTRLGDQAVCVIVIAHPS